MVNFFVILLKKIFLRPFIHHEDLNEEVDVEVLIELEVSSRDG